MGQVGDDPFGHFLVQTLRDNGVEVSHLNYSSAARTMLAFVSLHADGEREFLFYPAGRGASSRHPSADMLYRPEDVDPEYVRTARILHFGSISLIDEPSRSATLRAISIGRAAGALISFDPNLRLDLWPDADAARAGIRIGWKLAHVVKISEEELRFIASPRLTLSGASADDTAEAARAVWHPGLRLMVVTRGRRGSRYITPTFAGDVAGFSVEPVDTTGAGDGFVAGLLKGLLDRPDAYGDESQLRTICRYANAVGALTTTRRGAIPALPSAIQVDEFLHHYI
jgi:fructokinase